MGKRKTATPTDAELEILAVLRRRGPSTVREVQEEIVAQRSDSPLAYTSVLTLLQKMHKKRLVDRDASRRSHTYRAVKETDKAIENLLQRVIDRYFGGSLAHLFAQAATTERLSEDELRQIAAIIKEMRKGRS